MAELQSLETADIFQGQLYLKTQHFLFIILLVRFPLEMLIFLLQK